MPVDPAEFLEVARTSLEEGDAARLASDLLERWTLRDLCGLISSPCHDVRRVAAVALGLVGDASNNGCLAHALHDEDEQVREMAEHALWSIWFRSGRPDATQAFQHGLELMGLERYEQASELFAVAGERDPQFAEAWDQRAICLYMLERFDEAAAVCHRTLELNPHHFGAMSVLGHCYAHLNRFDEALDAYREAVRMNPRLDQIADAVQRIERRRRRRKGSCEGSGVFGARGGESA